MPDLPRDDMVGARGVSAQSKTACEPSVRLAYSAKPPPKTMMPPIAFPIHWIVRSTKSHGIAEDSSGIGRLTRRQTIKALPGLRCCKDIGRGKSVITSA